MTHRAPRSSPVWFLPMLVVTLATISRAGETTVNGMGFSLPEGFTIELAAGPPLVERPITIDFDERGRLYVAESSGTNDAVEKQLAEKPHSILRLEDTDGDGVFDRRTVFADKMMFPEGTMWHDGSLYVAAPPQIWKLTDTDDDGVADRREVWFDGKTLTGCANDLHGPYPGPDGYIYWCKGAFAEQSYERPGKEPFKTRAAHIFRRKADGTGPIEPVMTGGMDNPVDVVFLANGDRVFTTTFLVNPSGGQRDGLIHAIPGMIYGKDHDVVYGSTHKWTSPDFGPVLAHLGPAAPAGLARYESKIFGETFQDNLFACLFNMHKVTRHVLSPSGGTYAATTEDFLVSPDVDFHPTDVLEDADGTLLVVNTGGWYKLCCPTSQFHKPDVTGGIYRIRKTGATRVDDPRGSRIDWATLDAESLVELLDDARPAVVRPAIAALAQRPIDGSLTTLRRGVVQGTQRQRLGIVWTACRMGDARANGLLGTAAFDADETVRVAARNALAVLPPEALLEVGLRVAQDFGKEPSVAELAELALGDRSDLSRRAGAFLIGKVGGPDAVPPIFAALRNSRDPTLAHALTYALIQIADESAIEQGRSDPDPRVRRAAMVALDQTGSAGSLEPRQVAGWLADENEPLRRGAAWVIGRHPEWGGALADVFRPRLLDPTSNKADAARQAATLARAPEIQQLFAEALMRAQSAGDQVALLEGMSAADLPGVPNPWCAAVERLLSRNVIASEALDRALQLLRNRKISNPHIKPLAERLMQIAKSATFVDDLRLDALAAIPKGHLVLDETLLTFVVSMFDERMPARDRMQAADVLARADLNDEQCLLLAKTIKSAWPLELARLLPAFEKTNAENVGQALLDALEQANAGASVRPELLRPILAKYPQAIRDRADAFLDANNLDLVEQHKQLEALVQSLPKGDLRRGQAVFNGTKAACVSCHALGYVGGKVGPDLTRIGSIRTERDLLESIAFPSASFVRSYEPVAVATLDGRVLSGILKKDAPDEIILTIAADKEERVARGEIEEIRPATVSVMPAGLEQQLTPQELADLVAFLKACL